MARADEAGGGRVATDIRVGGESGWSVGDPAPTEPHQGHGAGAIVELGLEGGDATAGAQRDGPQHAVDGDDVAVGPLRDRRAGVRRRVAAQLSAAERAQLLALLAKLSD